MAGPNLRAVLLLAAPLMAWSAAAPEARADASSYGNPLASELFRDILPPSYRAWGGLDDALVGPGFAHEPNHDQDVYPFVVRGPWSHAGFHNSYSAYTSEHLFLDLRPARLLYNDPLVGLENQLQQRYKSTPYRASAFEPGAYLFSTPIGFWKDRSHAITEVLSYTHAPELELVDQAFSVPPPDEYVVPPDGWVGNIVVSTGQWRHLGYTPQNCVVQGGPPARQEYAQCHPYADGQISDSNRYDGEGSANEFRGACAALSSTAPPKVLVRPTVLWETRTFVVRDYEQQFDLDPLGNLNSLRVEDWTGRSGPILLGAKCDPESPTLRTLDLLVFPAGGNLATPITVSVTVTGWNSSWRTYETVSDTDAYDAFT